MKYLPKTSVNLLASVGCIPVSGRAKGYLPIRLNELDSIQPLEPGPSDWWQYIVRHGVDQAAPA